MNLTNNDEKNAEDMHHREEDPEEKEENIELTPNDNIESTVRRDHGRPAIIRHGLKVLKENIVAEEDCSSAEEALKGEQAMLVISLENW